MSHQEVNVIFKVVAQKRRLLFVNVIYLSNRKGTGCHNDRGLHTRMDKVCMYLLRYRAARARPTLMLPSQVSSPLFGRKS